MTALVEYRQLPDPDLITDSRTDAMLKLGFTTVKLLEQHELPWWP